MTVRQIVRVLCLAAVVGAASVGPLGAQPNPSPTALLLAKELIDVKGATKAFDPLIAGVIEYHKRVFIQGNPNLSRALDEVAQKLLVEMQPRTAELHQNLARVYAQHFTVQELKDALAFYKTPLGQKLVTEEPKVLDDAMKSADSWSSKFATEIVTRIRAEMKKKWLNLI